MTRLDPAEKVARAAARVLDALPEGTRERAEEIRQTVPGTGGTYWISHGRMCALFDAVEAWREAG